MWALLFHFYTGQNRAAHAFVNMKPTQISVDDVSRALTPYVLGERNLLVDLLGKKRPPASNGRSPAKPSPFDGTPSIHYPFTCVL